MIIAGRLIKLPSSLGRAYLNTEHGQTKASMISLISGIPQFQGIHHFR